MVVPEQLPVEFFTATAWQIRSRIEQKIITEWYKWFKNIKIETVVYWK